MSNPGEPGTGAAEQAVECDSAEGEGGARRTDLPLRDEPVRQREMRRLDDRDCVVSTEWATSRRRTAYDKNSIDRYLL